MRNRLGDTWLTTRHVAGGGVRVRVSPGGARLLGFQGNVPIALKHIQNDTNITTAGGCRASSRTSPQDGNESFHPWRKAFSWTRIVPLS